MRSAARVRELAEKTAEIYERNLLRAKAICDQYHIQMIAFLQPNLLTIGRPLTTHEQAVRDGMRSGLAVAIRACYPLLREKLETLKQKGVTIYDISDVFDGNVQPIFLDEYHVETTGNRLIAEAVLKSMLPVLWSSPSLREVALPVRPHRPIKGQVKPAQKSSHAAVTTGGAS
jgi:hypothetical protein